MGSQASSRVSRLPSRFPVGTRYVIEGHGGQIHLRYLEFPDGSKVNLPSDVAGRPQARNARRARSPRHKSAVRKI